MTKQKWQYLISKCRRKFSRYRKDHPAQQDVILRFINDIWLYRHGDRSDLLCEDIQRLCGRGT